MPLALNNKTRPRAMGSRAFRCLALLVALAALATSPADARFGRQPNLSGPDEQTLDLDDQAASEPLDLKSLGAKLIRDTNQLAFPSSEEHTFASLPHFFNAAHKHQNYKHKRQHQHQHRHENQNGHNHEHQHLRHHHHHQDDDDDEDRAQQANKHQLSGFKFRRRVCPASSFRCLDGHGCVGQHLMCDGQADCPDASDEQQCAQRDLELHIAHSTEPSYAKLRRQPDNQAGQLAHNEHHQPHAWHSIKAGLEERNLEPIRGANGLNSFLIALMFGFAVTATLLAIVSHKMRTIRRRYHRRHPSPVPDATEFCNPLAAPATG